MRQKKWISLFVFSACFFVLVFIVSDTVAQPREERPREGEGVPPETRGVEPAEDDDLKVKVWTDKGAENPTYYVGERIYVSFTVKKDCYVTIYDVDSTGNVNILFPNPYHKDNLVRKGRVYTIPTSNYGYDLVVKGPTGDELIFAVASSHIYYHWQYCKGCPPPIWSDQWGASSTWGHYGEPDSTVASRRFQKRLQMQEPVADKIIEYIKHHIELAKPVLVKYDQCRFYVTIPPY